MTPRKGTKGKTIVTASIFEAAHAMFRGGSQRKDIALALNISESIVYRILRYQDFESYKQANKNTYGSRNKKDKEAEKSNQKEINLQNIAFSLCLIGKKFYELASMIDEGITVEAIKHQMPSK